MASSPSSTSICSHCKVEAAQLRNGWKLVSDGFAKLCEDCCLEYENNTFCEKFHMDSDGWRDCRVCGMLIHCGCIVSLHMYETLDFGGIACIPCSRQSFVSEPNRYPSPVTSLEISADSRNSSGPEYAIDDAESTFGNQNASSEFSPSRFLPNEAALNFLTPFFPFPSNEVSLSDLSIQNTFCDETPLNLESSAEPSLVHSLDFPQNFISGEPIQTPLNYQLNDLKKTAETSTFSSVKSAEINEQSKGGSAGESKGLVRSSNNQIAEGDTSKRTKLSLRRLFEKTLTATDAEREVGRLVLPKLCAEVCFPAIGEGQQQNVIVQDSMGRDWSFLYRSWRNDESYIYVLDGIKSYMDLMDWKAGDIVTFHRIEPEGKLVIGTKKASSDSADSEGALPKW